MGTYAGSRMWSDSRGMFQGGLKGVPLESSLLALKKEVEDASSQSPNHLRLSPLPLLPLEAPCLETFPLPVPPLKPLMAHPLCPFLQRQETIHTVVAAYNILCQSASQVRADAARAMKPSVSGDGDDPLDSGNLFRQQLKVKLSLAPSIEFYCDEPKSLLVEGSPCILPLVPEL